MSGVLLGVGLALIPWGGALLRYVVLPARADARAAAEVTR